MTTVSNASDIIQDNIVGKDLKDKTGTCSQQAACVVYELSDI